MNIGTEMAHSALLSFQACNRNRNEGKWAQKRKVLPTISSSVDVGKEVISGKWGYYKDRATDLTLLIQKKRVIPEEEGTS